MTISRHLSIDAAGLKRQGTTSYAVVCCWEIGFLLNNRHCHPGTMHKTLSMHLSITKLIIPFQRLLSLQYFVLVGARLQTTYVKCLPLQSYKRKRRGSCWQRLLR